MKRHFTINGNSGFSVFKLIGFGVIIAGLVIAFGSVIMLLWNSLMPEIFGLGKISYFQGIGLLLLSRILIGGFGDGNKSQQKRYEKTYQMGPVTVQKGLNKEDELYDKWWEAEGEASFENFIDKQDQPEA